MDPFHQSLESCGGFLKTKGFGGRTTAEDINELAVATRHTEDPIDFFECKVTEHRELLQRTFPGFRQRPKHIITAHYPKMIRVFGPHNTEILFVCKVMTTWYHEHFRCFELYDNSNLSLCVQQGHFNDAFPLSTYRFGNNLMVTLKCYILG